MKKELILCRNCGENIDNELYTCEICGNEICDMCAEVCKKCGKYFCDACILEHHGK